MMEGRRWPVANLRLSVGHVTRIIVALATGSDVIVEQDDGRENRGRQLGRSVGALLSRPRVPLDYRRSSSS